jgi:hypothetical protein
MRSTYSEFFGIFYGFIHVKMYTGYSLLFGIKVERDEYHCDLNEKLLADGFTTISYHHLPCCLSRGLLLLGVELGTTDFVDRDTNDEYLSFKEYHDLHMEELLKVEREFKRIQQKDENGISIYDRLFTEISQWRKENLTLPLAYDSDDSDDSDDDYHDPIQQSPPSFHKIPNDCHTCT